MQKLRGHLNENTDRLIQQSAFENIVCKMSSILVRTLVY